jgi:diguanylate cyclase (GGDEF)-like protein
VGGVERAVGARSPWRDPLLLAVVGYAVAGCLYYLCDVGGFAVRVELLWVLQVPADLALSVLSWRVAGVPGITRSARRFWTTVSLGAALIFLGDIVHTVLTFRDPRPEALDGSTVQTGCFGVAIAAITVVMFTYSPGAGPGRERLRWWLDSVTVLVGGAVIAWYLAFDPSVSGQDSLGSGSGGRLTTVLTGSAVVLLTLFAGVRTMLSRSAPLTQLAAGPMLVALLLQCVPVFVAPLQPGEPIGPAAFLIRLLPTIVAVAGPAIQYRQASADPGVFARQPDTRYSLMPYIAATLTSVALLTSLPADAGIRIWGVVAGAVGTISLVVGRQLVALRELREGEGRLVEQATHDSLTRLLNRAGFAGQVAAALAAPANGGTALLLVDLDDFKNINDTLGHGVGDQLLVEVAGRLRAAVPDGGLVARFGGDEFAVLTGGGLNGADLTGGDPEATARRILDYLSTPIVVGAQTLLVHASVGATRAGPGDDLDALLRDADIALYEGKDRGKGTVVWYAPEMRTRLVETAELGARLRDGIGAGELRLVYQPIVGMDDGRIVGTEALVRWLLADGTMVSPGEFIPVAERTGLVVPLGRWVLREACRQAAAWADEHGTAAPQSMNVNVAGRQLQEPGFVDEVAAALADAELPAERLTIEVTETAALNGREVLATLHELRALGVRLALDDFGTAASSLGLLLTCPVTSLKLDRSFVESITTVTRQAAVATAVVQIAQALDLDVVAEGIETREQAALLRRLGYRRAQGFLYHRPQPPEELAELWAAHCDLGGSLPLCGPPASKIGSATP